MTAVLLSRSQSALAYPLTQSEMSTRSASAPSCIMIVDAAASSCSSLYKTTTTTTTIVIAIAI